MSNYLDHLFFLQTGVKRYLRRPVAEVTRQATIHALSCYRAYTVGHTKEPTRHGSLLTFWRFTNRIIIIIIINLFLFVTSSKQRILMLYSLLDLKNERYIRRHQFYPSHPSNVATLPCGFSKHWKCNITAGYCQRKLHEMYGSFIEMDQGHVPYINTIECLSKVYKNCKHMTQRHDLLYS